MDSTRSGLARLGTVLVFSLSLSGCFTSVVRWETRFGDRQEYRPEQYPLGVKGMYYGKFESDGVVYDHYSFKHYPWPFNSSNATMGIILTQGKTEEPIIVAFVAPSESHGGPHGLMRHLGSRNAITLQYPKRREPTFLDIPASDSGQVLNLPALLFVTVNEAPPFTRYPDDDVNHFVYIVATRNGPGSTIRTGQRKGDDLIDWSTPQMIKSKPTRHGWASKWHNALYAISVPLDIATLPLQIPLYLIGVNSLP